MVKSHASLFVLKFWTFNLGNNRLTLELVFRVEGRSTILLITSLALLIMLQMFSKGERSGNLADQGNVRQALRQAVETVSQYGDRHYLAEM